MKGIDSIIATVLIIVITITAIGIATQMGGTSTDKAKEILLMQEGKDNLVAIDSRIGDVLAEGEGSTRVLKLTVSGGYYEIAANSIAFSMDSRAQIVGSGVSKIEDGINITGAPGKVYLRLAYSNIEISGSAGFGKGPRSMTIRNSGYNSTTERQIVLVSVS